MINPEFIELHVADIDNPDGWTLVVRVDDIVAVNYPRDAMDAAVDYNDVTLRNGVVYHVAETVQAVVQAMVASGRCKVTNNPGPYSKTAADREVCEAG